MMLKYVLAILLLACCCASLRAEQSPLAAVKLDDKTFVGKPGFFRVGKDAKGNWWFVTPDNKPFYYRGVTSINSEGTAGGRRAPEGPYHTTITTKYGKDEKAFASEQIRRLRKWNFNALGAWTTSEFYELPVDGAIMPYTEIVEFGYIGPQIRGEGIWLPDVFDPKWEKAADEWAKKICEPLRDNKHLIGYFTDNELSWAQPSEEDIAAQTDPELAKKVPPRMWLLQHCLSLPEDAAAFTAAWDFVLARHGNSFEKLSKAYGITIKNRAALRELNPNRVTIIMADGTRRLSQDLAKQEIPPVVIRTAAFKQDTDAFSKLYAERYFRLTSELIRKHDPNHLILGARFGGPPGEVVLAAHKKEWVDVLSANNYRPNMRERMDAYHKATGLPVLVGEFAYHSGLFAIRTNRNWEKMAAMGEASIEEMYTSPGIVGYTWYRWVQDQGSARQGLSCGLVNTKDEEHPIHIPVLTRVNGKADASAAARTGR